MPEAYTKSQLLKMFEGSVSREHLERILALDPPLSTGAEERVVTVWFSDVVGAAALAGSLGYEPTRRRVAQYLEAVTEMAVARNGYVCMFVADEAMVLFGAPIAMDEREQVLAAADLSLAILSRAKEMNLAVGVGFDQGKVALGSFASASKPGYIPFGSGVNLAARIEGWSHDRTGGRAAVTDAVGALVAATHRTVYVSPLDRHPRLPAGEAHIHAIVGRHDDLRPHEKEMWDRYDLAMAHISAARPAMALAILGELSAGHPEDRLMQTALERARAIYAEKSGASFQASDTLDDLYVDLGTAIAALFGQVRAAILEEAIDGVWRFCGHPAFEEQGVVLAPTGDAMTWLRGLGGADWTREAPESVRSLGLRAVAPLRTDNRLVGALFVDCAEGTDLGSLTILANALSRPWKSRHSDDLRRRYRSQVDDAQKLSDIIRELEAKSVALERSLAENQALNRTLEERVADHARRLERASSLKRYLPPHVVEDIIEGGRDLGARTERRKITVMFSDIRGFTAATDGLEPEELSRLLNGYLSAMSRIAFEAGGTIDKFRGDGMMVFFGAPQPMETSVSAKKCLDMAIRMIREVVRLRELWFSEGYDWDLGVRMGINTGYATVGEFGSENRLDYTAIGTEVNLAARLEAACEPDTILISHSTWAHVRDEFRCMPLDPLQLKGIHRKVLVYRVEWHEA